MATLVPLGLLLGYAVLFAVAALGRGLPAFDDHPGQFFRLWHALERSFPEGAWTADWNPDWWAGYPELQFYPPGFVLVGAAIRLAGFWQPSVEAVYQLLVGVTYLLPGLGTWCLLRAVLGDGWLALPPAFAALTLSAGLRGGVEEGVRWGMVTSRLAVGVLAWLALSLRPWVEGAGRPRWAPALAALAFLCHPASGPVVLALVALAGVLHWLRAPGGGAVRQVLTVGALAAGLTAFWLGPLLGRRAWFVPLGWTHPGAGGFLGALLGEPFLVAILLAGPLGWVAVARERRPFEAVVAAWPAALLALGALHYLAYRVGTSPIEPTRLHDALVLGSLWSAGLGLGRLAMGLAPRARVFSALAAVGALLVVATAAGRGRPEPILSLWAPARDWPTWAEVRRRHGLDALGAALAGGADRVLVLASRLPLGADPAWYAPHSHAWSLLPRLAGREVVHGTFTHPSPLAARLYTGTVPPRLQHLAEELDGRTLLGKPWEQLDPTAWDALARRLRIQTVLVPAPEARRARFLGQAYRRVGETAGLVRYERQDRPWPVLERLTHRRYRVLVPPTGGVWVPTGIPAYPLWRVKSARGVLETRTDSWGLLEFRVPLDVFEAELVYAEGALEWASLALTGGALVAWVVWAAARPRAPAGRPRRPRPSHAT